MRCESDGPASLPRVLVLLASRNGASYIERQICGVLAQKDVNVQLQVRDDGSSDMTRDIVSRLSVVDGRVMLLEDHVATGSASGNYFALVRQAHVSAFDYVAFCDQDDEWFSDKLSRAVNFLRASGAGGYSSAVSARWPDGRTEILSQSSGLRAADYLFEGAGQGCTFVFAAPIFAMLQAQLVRAVELLPLLHYHDWALHALARSSGLRWVFDSRPSMIYHQHAENDTGARSSSSGIIRRLKLIRSGWYRAQINAMVALIRRVNPEDRHAAEWAALNVSSASSSIRARWAKCRFIALNGRRKRTDRWIQLIAVALGYL